MGILVLISLLATVVYLAVVIARFGVPVSLSDSYYLFEKHKKGFGRFFTLWSVVTGFPLMGAWLFLSEGLWYQFLSFLAPGALMFLGVAAEFKEELTARVHYGAAGVCVVAAGAWCLLEGCWLVVSVCYTIAALVALRDRKWVFWAEMAAFVSTYWGVVRLCIDY